jgi:hypothetical protein
MKIALKLVALAALMATVSAASPARACWDGYQASVGNVTLSIPGEAEWSPETARTAARWGARIEALLGSSRSLQSFYSNATVCLAESDGSCGATLADVTWNGSQLSDLFVKVAAATRASPATVKRARAVDVQPLTIQVFAGRTDAAAKAFAARINDAHVDGLDGYYVAGGFPDVNPSAHVIAVTDASGRPLDRVVVGAFLSRADALASAARLTSETGIVGFARPL